MYQETCDVEWNESHALPVINPNNDRKYQVKFLVVEENWTPLLDLSAVEEMKLLTVHSNFFNVVKKSDDNLLIKYPEVFLMRVLGHCPARFIFK